MEGVTLTPLKIIPGELGTVMKAISCLDQEFKSFGEAYFSTVKKGSVKGWKKHTRMICTFVVPQGSIRFVIFDNRPGSATENQYFEIILSTENYQRLSLMPGLWMAFEGIGEGTNMLLNVASIPHDPTEAETTPVANGSIPYPPSQS